MHRSPQFFIALLALAVAARGRLPLLSNRQLLQRSLVTHPRNETFDYVIIGGGTAGLTVALRLTENPTISVAVIEAGGFYEVDSGNTSVVPGYSTFYAGTDPRDTDSEIDWGFVTTPQAACSPPYRDRSPVY